MRTDTPANLTQRGASIKSSRSIFGQPRKPLRPSYSQVSRPSSGLNPAPALDHQPSMYSYFREGESEKREEKKRFYNMVIREKMSYQSNPRVANVQISDMHQAMQQQKVGQQDWPTFISQYFQNCL